MFYQSKFSIHKNNWLIFEHLLNLSKTNASIKTTNSIKEIIINAITAVVVKDIGCVTSGAIKNACTMVVGEKTQYFDTVFPKY
jgi:hypothetical protein